MCLPGLQVVKSSPLRNKYRAHTVRTRSQVGIVRQGSCGGALPRHQYAHAAASLAHVARDRTPTIWMGTQGPAASASVPTSAASSRDNCVRRSCDTCRPASLIADTTCVRARTVAVVTRYRHAPACPSARPHTHLADVANHLWRHQAKCYLVGVAKQALCVRIPKLNQRQLAGVSAGTEYGRHASSRGE